ncbi:hypothetical protein GF374_00280 [Candidatus Woesearchaeota archaeon]|nr:hypothetical protein [Candidatus Woesearchaeota archaeon]
MKKNRKRKPRKNKSNIKNKYQIIILITVFIVVASFLSNLSEATITGYSTHDILSKPIIKPNTEGIEVAEPENNTAEENIQEESNECLSCGQETIEDKPIIQLEKKSSAPQGNSSVYEVDFVSDVNGWTTINLSKSFTNPVVIVTGQEGADISMDVEASRPMIENITSDSFSVKVMNDQSETVTEDIGYLVMEEGHWIIDGIEFDAGTYSVTADNNDYAISYNQTFGNDTVVVDTLQTGCTEVVSSRYVENSIDSTGFTVWWEDFSGLTSEANLWSCGSATAGYIAMEKGAQSSYFESGEYDECAANPGSSNWCSVTFSNSYVLAPILFVNPIDEAGTDSTVTGRRSLSTTGVDLRPTESRTADTEQNHAVDDIVWMIWVKTGVFWTQSSLDLGDGYLNNGDLSATTNITSGEENNNTVVNCISGSCNTITDNWTDGTNLTDTESQIVNFTCNDSSIGSYSANFKVNSTQDSTGDTITVTCDILAPKGTLIVNLTNPTANQTTNVYQNQTFSINATITCGGVTGAKCEEVNGTARYSEYGSLDLKQKHGYFQTPASPGNKSINIGFEPEVIVFTITATNNNFDAETNEGGSAFGWGHGFAYCNDSGCTERVLSDGSGSSSTNGYVAASSDDLSILQIITDINGDVYVGNVSGTVVETNSSGFKVRFDSTQEQQYVTYTAYNFPDGAEVKVGDFATKTSEGAQHINTGFKPNFLYLITTPEITNMSYFESTGDGGSEHGWMHGLASERNDVIEQLSMAQTLYAKNIDSHVWASNNSEIMHTLWKKDSPTSDPIDGRIQAYLKEFNNTGFTLNYTNVNPDTTKGSEFAVIYLTIKTDLTSDIGYNTTPTSTGVKTIPAEIKFDAINLIGTNTIPDINQEGWSGDNQADAHWGYMFGSGNASVQRAMGFSSHSNSVNAHGSASSSSDSFYLIYTDQNGNIDGKDIANIKSIDDTGFDLNFTTTVTSTSSSVKYDSTLFFYYGFSKAYENKDINTTTGATPLYTTDSQPQSCANMSKDDSCSLSWNVNATGTISSLWNVNVLFSSNDSTISSNSTDNALLNITPASASDENAPTISSEAKYPSTVYNDDNVQLNATVVDGEGNLDTVWISGNWTGAWENTTVTDSDGDVFYFWVGAGNFSNQQIIGWRYFANDTFGNLQMGNLQEFGIANRKPSNVSLLLPTNATVTADNTTSFDWTNASDEDGDSITYILQIDNDSDFSSVTLQKTGLTISNYTLTNPESLAEGVYYWRVYSNDSFATNVSDVWQLTINDSLAIAVSLSTKLSGGINWTINSLPSYNQFADGNNNSGITEYDIAISATGTNVDVYIKADDDLSTVGGDTIGIGNETYNYNLTNNLVPNSTNFKLTTNYADNKIGDNLADGSYVYLKFYLNISASQPPGTYSNNVNVKAVPHGESP